MALVEHNRQFLKKIKSNERIFNNSEKYGVGIKSFTDISVPVDAKQYWRVIGVYHLTGTENMGNHHLYADVLDADGRRVKQARLKLMQGNSAPQWAVIDKPANEPGTNFPLWSHDRAAVSVNHPADNPLPSEVVTGIMTGHADEEIGNTWGHHSFYVVFQLTNIPEPGDGGNGDDPDENVSPPTNGDGEPPLTLEDTIALVGQPKIIPLNPDAMFYKIAQQQKLGERLTAEYDAEFNGKTYRAQIYEKGIVYAEVGDWGNTKIIPRVN